MKIEVKSFSSFYNAGSPFNFGVKNVETLAITGFESVLNMKHTKMLRTLLKT